MLQRIDLCRFQAKQTFTVTTEASSKWNSRMKMRKPNGCPEEASVCCFTRVHNCQSIKHTTTYII